MTTDQKGIAGFGAAVMIAMCLFPPWREMAAAPLNLERSRGYSWLLNTPIATGSPYSEVGMDWAVLLTQASVVVAAVAVLEWIFRARLEDTGRSFSERLRRRAFVVSWLGGCLLPFPTAHGAPAIIVFSYSLVGETGHIPRLSLLLWSLGAVVGYSLLIYGLVILTSRLLRPTGQRQPAP